MTDQPRIPGPTFAELGINIDNIDEGDLDQHPFGAIKLDLRGRIVEYNRYEQELAKRSRGEAIGKSFFFEVAPCTRVRSFYGRFRDGIDAGWLDATFEFVFTFDHGPRNVEVTLLHRAPEPFVWVLVRG